MSSPEHPASPGTRQSGDVCGRLPARRRNLLDQPQRLGLLPTYWFWNDRERQRLLLPLMTLNGLLVTPPLFLLVVYFELPMWLLLIMITLWPQILMGLVERRVRAELHRRERDGVARQPPESSLPGSRSGNRVFLVLATACAAATVLSVAPAWGAVAAALTALGLALLVGLAWYSAGRLGQLESSAATPPALPVEGDGRDVAPDLSPDDLCSPGSSAAAR